MNITFVRNEGNCYYCNKPVNNLACNPSEWGIPLCHKDEPGKVKTHHIGCVSERLEQLKSTRKENEKLKRSPYVCPHGIRHYEHYCRECSLTKIEEEWNHTQELQKENEELKDCLKEAIDLMEDTISGEYKPDSFTTQPWKRALRKNK